MAKFSERIKELRESRGFTQKQYATILKMTERAYQLYEQDGGFPTYKRLIEIADYFDISLDYLVGRSDIRQRR